MPVVRVKIKDRTGKVKWHTYKERAGGAKLWKSWIGNKKHERIIGHKVLAVKVVKPKQTGFNPGGFSLPKFRF